MCSSTPSSTSLRRSAFFRKGHPARWIAPLLLITALCTGYAVCAGQPEPQASDIPTIRMEAAPSAEVIAKLTRATELAQAELEKSTAQLAALKTSSESAGDVSDLQRTADDVQQELQQATSARDTHRELLQLLQPAQTDPARITAVPDKVLESQPTVRQVKEAWTAAHAKTAELLVTLLPDHPRVQACQVEENEMCGRLRGALDVAIRDLQAEQIRLDAQVDALAKNSADVQERVQRFAAIQADYNNQAALVRRQSAELNRAQQRLSKARTNPAVAPSPAAGDGSDNPQLLPPARGPGRVLLIAAALVGGVFVSLGLFMLRGSPATAVRVPPEHVPAADSAPARTTPTATSPLPPLPAIGPVPALPRATGMTLKQALARCAAGEAGSDRR